MGRRKPLSERERLEREAELRARGERIRDLRLRAGFPSQMDVVRSGRLDSGTLSNIEGGRKDMYVTTALALADAYGVPLDVLVNRAPVPPVEEPYPARMAVTLSPEFGSAPAQVREWFATLAAEGCESWSPLKWARVFDQGLALFVSGVRLQNAPGSAAVLAVVRPPSTPPPSSTRR